MPVGDQSGLRQGVEKGLRLAIPLVLQKRRIEASENRFSQQISMKKLELMQDSLEAKDEMQAELIQREFENRMDESQLQLDRDKLTQKTQQEKDELELDKLQTAQDASKPDKPGIPRFYQHKDDPNKIITIQGNQLPPEGFVPYAKPGKGKDKTISPTERRQTAKDVAKAEEEIAEGNFAQIDFFNQYAKKPYVYVSTEGKEKSLFGIDYLYPDEAPGTKQIKLPKSNGKQVYASDVYENMMEYDKTFEEVLREIGAME